MFLLAFQISSVERRGAQYMLLEECLEQAGWIPTRLVGFIFVVMAILHHRHDLSVRKLWKFFCRAGGLNSYSKKMISSPIFTTAMLPHRAPCCQERGHHHRIHRWIFSAGGRWAENSVSVNKYSIHLFHS